MVCGNNNQLRTAKKNEEVKPRLTSKGLCWEVCINDGGTSLHDVKQGKALPDFILEKILWKSCLWFLDYRQPFLLLHEDHIASMLASLTAL